MSKHPVFKIGQQVLYMAVYGRDWSAGTVHDVSDLKVTVVDIETGEMYVVPKLQCDIP